MTEKMMFTPFDRFFPSVRLWIESITLIYYYSVKTVVLFQLELSLATVSELIISPFFFFPPFFFRKTACRELFLKDCFVLFFSCLGTDFLFLEFGKMTVPKISLSLPST